MGEKMETKLSVTLIQHTPDPEKLVSAAAKLCYSKANAGEIMENLTDENVKGFLNRLMDVGHASPTEHASFTFAIEGVSRALTHQLVRHRMASFSQKSQRYVNETQFGFVIPPEIEEDTEMKNKFIECMDMVNGYYNYFSRKLTEKGRTKEQSSEDARFVLPNSCETKIVVTMNARELLHFFEQRCCNRAQWEIRTMADEMLKQCKEVAPLLFKKAGAPCTYGSCPEGKMCCGNPRK